MSSDRPLYVMDDDYIEQKYVKAEEERQKQEEEQRVRREAEEKKALEVAERQRKLAEAERRRKKEELENLERLEAAKKLREAEEAKRKEQEASFQSKLDEINDELAHLETVKSKFLTDKLALAKDLQAERQGLEEPLSEIRKEKEELENKERELVLKLKQFEHKADVERIALEQREISNGNRVKELLASRRQVQTDMLNFLQQPTANVSVTITKETPKETLNPSPVPKYPSLNQSDKSSFYSNFEPSVEIVGLNKNNTSGATTTTTTSLSKQENDLQEQLSLLDEFLRTGVLTQPDYDDARKRLFDDFNKNHPAAVQLPVATKINNPSNNNNNNKSVGVSGKGVEEQLKQLDEWLRQGVIGQTEYEETQSKLLQDAGLLNTNKVSTTFNNNNNSLNTTFRQNGNVNSSGGVGGGFKVVSMTVPVPYGKHGGQTMQLTYAGKQYNVVVPPNLKPGQTFVAQIPVPI